MTVIPCRAVSWRVGCVMPCLLWWTCDLRATMLSLAACLPGRCAAYAAAVGWRCKQPNGRGAAPLMKYQRAIGRFSCGTDWLIRPWWQDTVVGVAGSWLACGLPLLWAGVAASKCARLTAAVRRKRTVGAVCYGVAYGRRQPAAIGGSGCAEHAVASGRWAAVVLTIREREGPAVASGRLRLWAKPAAGRVGGADSGATAAVWWECRRWRPDWRSVLAVAEFRAGRQAAEAVRGVWVLRSSGAHREFRTGGCRRGFASVAWTPLYPAGRPFVASIPIRTIAP